MRSIIHSLLVCTIAAFSNLPLTSVAAYPERAITMIVAYVPGGGTDVVARALAPYIEKHIGGGAKIIVVNRSGAGGEVGFTALANAAADGYTIGFINSPGVLTIPIERPAQYTWQRFDLLGNIVDDPACFTVHADSAFKDLAQLAAYAKANPDAVSVGTPGIGSTGHLAILIFAKLAGTKVNHVPFKGTGDVRTALAGRQIVVGAITVGESFQALKGGMPLRVLAQLSTGRTDLAPNLATAKEQGYQLEMSSLRGLAAPKGLPADVRARLVKAVAQAVADPEFQVKSLQYYAPLRYLSPAQFETTLQGDEIQLRQLWREIPWSEK
jgi:putative tricarboxylic transport membrane protein